MRLLNVQTKLLEEYFDDAIRSHPYAILSHTWGKDEVLFSHIQEKGYRGGSKKVDGCIAQAVKDGYGYIWIDTCCIDKSSSAELSEAINSMFRWYEMAEVCYVYLEDVPAGLDPFGPDSAFRNSRWFTRGWTLQELLAPNSIEFFCSSWLPVIESEDDEMMWQKFFSLLSEITRIPGYLFDPSWRGCRSISRPGQGVSGHSIAQKMSWASGRSTTRLEDRAYSLLGIFGVNMPLLYGEGEKAFVRLQEKIMEDSDDQSLFAWGYEKPVIDLRDRTAGLFARSPDDFSNAGDIDSSSSKHHYAMTNKGLLVNLQLTDFLQSNWTFNARLTCYKSDPGNFFSRGIDRMRLIGLPLIYDGETFYRDTSRPLEAIQSQDEYYLMTNGHEEPRYIRRYPSIGRTPDMFRPGFTLCEQGLRVRGCITECYPERWTTALKDSRCVPWISVSGGHERGEDVILFRYSGGHIPSFLGKLHYRFATKDRGITYADQYMVPQHMTCALAWFPLLDHIWTLEDLIADHLVRARTSALDQAKDSTTSTTPDPRWCDALDAALDWQADLSLNVGTTVSVRILSEPDSWGYPFLKLCFQLQKTAAVSFGGESASWSE